ncbi:LamG-like jellyroll fold domain-containing protein [Pedobacter frigoris]|uniref:LamG-like jellyroll fold domain-containing protein n=1 Tax=Pedobacter frigoris TaxID=2571272 RepID=UPI00292F9653|nr:LamG-like jellyroll fold domain-containing protein [Pedobacter frigoris]
MNTYKLVVVLIATLFVSMISACNKDFPNRLKTSSENDTLGINAKGRKVLYIIVDGVRGKALKEINPPNIAKMTKNAIYAYDGLVDFDKNAITNAGGWANMVTGVMNAKHGVVSEDFSGNKLSAYPSLFTQLKAINPQLRTVSIASSGVFNTNLAADATAKLAYENNDVSVKNAVKDELKNADATLVLAQFHGAEIAGRADSYENESASYTNAILQIDTYIGEILDAMSKRKTFADENWLVVLASNKGGSIVADPNSTDFTSYADATRNNFIVFYNPRFNTLFVPKPDSEKIPYTNNSVRFDFTTSTRPTAVIQDVNAYNFGSLGNYTIELLIKSKGVNPYYPTFLSKRAAGFSGTGWNLFLEYGNIWGINSSLGSQAKGRVISDDIWHKLSIVFDGKNAKLRVYTDGQFDQEVTMNNTNVNNTAPLKLGYLPSDGNQSASILMNSLQIYNVALTAQEIANNSCKTTITESNPNYKNLIGYWLMNEGKGSTFKELTGKGKDFLMGGTPTWESFDDVGSRLCPDISNSFYAKVPNSVDIPFEIYQWLGISIKPKWDLDGKSWNPIYSDIKP